MESRTVDVDALEKRIKGKLRRKSTVSAKCCIFKVPEVLRRHRPEAYEPDVVSIGPLHHGSGKKTENTKKFQHMENVKHWYLNELLSRKNISLKTLINEGIDVVEFWGEARAFYADPLDDLEQDDFIEMMILDGCFLLELFDRSSKIFKKKKNPKLQERDDGCFLLELLFRSFKKFPQAKTPSMASCSQVKEAEADPLLIGDDSVFNMACMVQYLCHDLLLLENQIPWFVLNRLYSLTIESHSDQPSLTKLVLDFFSILSELDQHCKCYKDGQKIEILHILALIRSTIVDTSEESKSDTKSDDQESKSDTKSDDQESKSDTKSDDQKSKSDTKSDDQESKSDTKSDDQMLPATLLAEAGVKFMKAKDDNIRNIGFENGVLTIPHLLIAELTEPLLRNLIAFEQCYHGCKHKVTSYARLMDSLIASSKDAHLLRKKGILSNWLSDEDAFNFFEKLYNDTFVRVFCYNHLCGQVNEYQKHRRNKWRAGLKRDYCSNPWKIISLGAAIILLVLTALQTAYTIQQYYYPPQ